MDCIKVDSKIDKFSLTELMETGLQESSIAVVDPLRCNTFIGFIAYNEWRYSIFNACLEILEEKKEYYSIKELIEDNQRFDYYIL